MDSKQIQIESSRTLRKEFYVKCSHCGKFVSIVKEYNGYYLICDTCNTEKFVKYISYKNILNLKDFSPVFKHDKENTIKIFKDKVYPIHSYDSYPLMYNNNIKEKKHKQKTTN